VSVTQLARDNLLSPPVLGFGLGVLGARLRSEMRLPAPLPTLLSTYLLLAIGVKGGIALRGSDLSDLLAPLGLTLALGAAIPGVVFVALRRFAKVPVPLAAAFAAFYGSVSAVTFTAAMTFMESEGIAVEPFLPALLAVLEVPGIVVALVLAARAQGTQVEHDLTEAGSRKVSLRGAIHEVLSGKSIMLLLGGIVIGVAPTEASVARIEPLFVGLFAGVLVLFLVDLGGLAGEQLKLLRTCGRWLPITAVVAPLVFGSIGVLSALAIGMSPGGATVFGAMAASASYIAAPAAVRVAMPEVDVSIPLTAAIGITFPFNLVIGIPLFYELSVVFS
jgi:uncharacterized protein